MALAEHGHLTTSSKQASLLSRISVLSACAFQEVYGAVKRVVQVLKTADVGSKTSLWLLTHCTPTDPST